MPRFHFEIVDGVEVSDPVGTVCTENQAKQHAKDIAEQIAIDMGTEHRRNVVVKDDSGAEIHKVPVKT